MNWFRRLKARLGYYEARRALWKKPFLDALRPSDTFLIGHPKSGNTWLAYMLAILLVPDRAEPVTLRNVGRFVPFVHGRDHRIRRHDRLPDPRVFRNEYPQYPALYPRIIYLYRDPRAVLVSLWHMYRVMFDEDRLPLARFVDDYLAEDGIFKGWHGELERWDRQVAHHLDLAASESTTASPAPAESRILVLRYEDLVRDRRDCLQRLMGFLGISRTDEAVEQAVRRGGFEAMRRVEERHGAEAFEGKAKGEGRFVRRGEVDGWRDEMGDSAARRIEEELGPVMCRAGYLPDL